MRRPTESCRRLTARDKAEDSEEGDTRGKGCGRPRVLTPPPSSPLGCGEPSSGSGSLWGVRSGDHLVWWCERKCNRGLSSSYQEQGSFVTEWGSNLFEPVSNILNPLRRGR